MYSTRERDDTALMVWTALVTFAAALGVSGGTNVVMLLTGSDLIKKHRPTLTFKSAIIGDGVILPFINVLMMRAFKRWKPSLSARTALTPVVGGSLISLAFHIAQGRGGMVNWTMTKPWRWNLLGYYHFVYMATQFSYMLLYLTQLAGRWPKGDVEGSDKRDLALILANLVAFAALLQWDYSE
jgi:hypothetical protein